MNFERYACLVYTGSISGLNKSDVQGEDVDVPQGSDER